MVCIKHILNSIFDTVRDQIFSNSVFFTAFSSITYFVRLDFILEEKINYIKVNSGKIYHIFVCKLDILFLNGTFILLLDNLSLQTMHDSLRRSSYPLNENLFQISYFLFFDRTPVFCFFFLSVNFLLSE